jgi:hypothetical protein
MADPKFAGGVGAGAEATGGEAESHCGAGASRDFEGGAHGANVTRLPPFSKTVHREVRFWLNHRDEFERAVIGYRGGGAATDGRNACVTRVAIDGHPGLERSRECAAQCLESRRCRDQDSRHGGLQEIEKAINDHPTTGGAKRSNSERHLRHGSRNGS